MFKAIPLNSISVVENQIKIPKLGLVKFAKSQEPQGKIQRETIRQNANGKFFVPILYEEEMDELPKIDSAIGYKGKCC